MVEEAFEPGASMSRTWTARERLPTSEAGRSILPASLPDRKAGIRHYFVEQDNSVSPIASIAPSTNFFDG